MRRSAQIGAARLSMFGVAGGVAALIVVLAVMNGFQSGTIRAILELNSFHLQIAPAPSDSAFDALLTQAVPDLRGATRFVDIQVLARGFWPDPAAINLRATDSDWFEHDLHARETLNLRAGTLELDRGVVLGDRAVIALGLRIGDQVALTHIAGGRPIETQLPLVGVYSTGYVDIDTRWGFLSIDLARQALAGDDPPGIGIKLTQPSAAAAAADRLRAVVPHDLQVEGWQSYNRGIFGALRAEKSLMVVLVGLILIVVAGNLFQLLRRSALERAEDIAVLLALGASARQVQTVFLWKGFVIGWYGATAGTVIGLAIATNVRRIFDAAAAVASLVGLGDYAATYLYLFDVPTRVVAAEVALVVSGALVICLAASVLAARRVTLTAPQSLLRGV